MNRKGTVTIMPITIQGEEYLTHGEVLAHAGGKSESWLKPRLRKGLLHEHPLPGNSRQKYYKRSEVDALLVPMPSSSSEVDVPPDADVLTAMQVAAKLQVSEGYVYQLIEKGALQAIDLSPEEEEKRPVYRILRSEYERFKRERAAKKRAKKKRQPVTSE